ncbi:phosphate ABC transporter substrate-binding protein PstS [Roseofilum reptotaenium CS-1145]|uniref:Phosphate-binding protein n=1 Tax=Roseofilum reptotaenium AO1-A TaxID=1925591 RepID=A0A1L9QUL4_9CYAN|nr:MULTISPECIES: phosphate ABC transporter substrate-binding protein PstS [Roseofilum]MBP0028042.1 phosphate ABC transporter substrate-binding protein PstS [Roseofilum sp. Guam]MDB9517708.1 phosphate ABC transporter substrate-binding protein PstS [Roseofilum reptotaenium CS-1145]OJJ26339.1 phosphate ABC transporter substrate-binding protein PstS [Roseofilum reptotaenium AO1-A]
MFSFSNCKRKSISLLIAALSAVALASCAGGDDTSQVGSTTGGGEAKSTSKLALAGNTSLTGAGASFPAPLYQRWFLDFSNATPNLQIDYQSVGSGAGVERFMQNLVNFGASDVAMKDDEISEVDKGVLMLPMTAGSVVMAYNLPGVDELNLTQEALIDILLGNITQWNDPKIASANSGITLPDTNITVVYRSDGSGTTGVFTKNLSAMSEEWKNQVGEGKTVEWPVGIGGAKNDGVAAQVRQTEGAIGYLELGFAKSAGLNMASLENKSGNFIYPTDEAASQSLAAVQLPENLRAFVTNPEGEESYPIVTYTWLLAYKEYDDPEIAKSVEAMIEYGLNEGQTISADLGYIPLPDNVREKVAMVADSISPDYEIEVK